MAKIHFIRGEVEVIRRDRTRVWVDLSNCLRMEINGQDHYQTPAGWCFYKHDEGWTHERKTVDSASKTPAVMDVWMPRFSYRESELAVSAPEWQAERKPRPSATRIGRAVRKAIIEWFENQPKGRKFRLNAIAAGIGRTSGYVKNHLPSLVRDFGLLANDPRAGLWWRTDKPVPPGFSGDLTSENG
jgi:hypothetical protein